MTCIAAAVDKDGTIWMGADSVSSVNDKVRRRANPKVARCGQFLIGASGTVRVGQVIRYLFKPPKLEADLDRYMVTFANKLRECVKEHGAECENDEDKTLEANGNFLIGFGERLFEIDAAYGVLAPLERYHAIGSGDQEAVVAMFMVKSLFPDSYSAEQMVRWGLKAAAEFDLNIREPFTVISLPERVRPKRKR